MTLNEIVKNYQKEPLKIKWKELKRADAGSDYKSQCPECNFGILLMQRDQETLKLLKEDYCISCGRRFIYTDLDETGLK